jgi:chromosome partitioning protein
MNSKIIVFANLKGGVGKSTLCIEFANYLGKLGQAVAVIDADIQQTIYQLRQNELQGQNKSEDEVPWDVMWLDTREQQNIESVLEAAREFPGFILIDAPGNVTDDDLLPIYYNADYIICPTSYDPKVVSSTEMFGKLMTDMSSSLRKEKIRNRLKNLFFLPNMIDVRKGSREEQRQRMDAAKVQLQPFGILVDRISDRSCIFHASTLEFTNAQYLAVQPPFDYIYSKIK